MFRLRDWLLYLQRTVKRHFPAQTIRAADMNEPPALYGTLRKSLLDYSRRQNDVYSYTRALATERVIFNHGQVTRTTADLAPPSPNYHTTPTGGRLSSRQI
ncbi:hypothetical protein TNCV_1185111 [Trichonephila clavipes]|nr:hypothetical protein TNCV_1185111 [Trichonephila clavipes]